MPVIPDCRIQNSVYMVGEKVSSMIPGPFLKMTHLMDLIRVPTLSSPNIRTCMRCKTSHILF